MRERLEFALCSAVILLGVMASIGLCLAALGVLLWVVSP